jgi:hypothetical protein
MTFKAAMKAVDAKEGDAAAASEALDRLGAFTM